MRFSCTLIKQSSICLILFLWGLPLIMGQEVEGPEEIISEFRNELTSSRQEGTDTIGVYEHYLGILISRGNYLHADSIFSTNLSNLMNLNDSARITRIIESRAFMYKVQRRYSNSLEDYLWLKTYYEGRKDTSRIIDIYSLLAEYYRAIGLYELSKKHLDEAERLFKTQIPSNRQQAFWLSRKAALANEYLKNQDSVIFYSLAGLKLVEHTDDSKTQALILNEIGYSLMTQNYDEDTIMTYFNRSKQILLEQAFYRDYIEVVNNIANYYFSNNELNNALNLVETIIPIEVRNKWYAPLQTSLQYAVNICGKLGEHEKKDEYLHQLYEARLANQTSHFEILLSDNELKYENSMTLKDLEVQAQKAVLAQEEAKTNQQAFTIALLISLFLLIIVISSFYINLRFRKKNLMLEKQREKIQITNLELEKLLKKQKALFQELNHRVKNNLTILTSLIYLQEVRESDEYLKETLKVLRNRIKSMALAHESLYQNENIDEIDFNQYLQYMLADLKSAFSLGKNLEVNVDCHIPPIDIKKAIPLAMIMNELFTNSIKYAFVDLNSGEISIQGKFQDNHIHLDYRDNGKGFINTEGNKKSLGMKLIKLICDQLDATFENLSQDKGVHFNIQFKP